MLVQHNILLSLSDELTPLFKDIFTGSEAARNYSSRRTKTTCIVNGAIAPILAESMRSRLFAIAIDGSSDNRVEKMNPQQFELLMMKVIICTHSFWTHVYHQFRQQKTSFFFQKSARSFQKA